MFRVFLFLFMCLPAVAAAESMVQEVSDPAVPGFVHDYLPNALDWRSYYVNSLAVRMAPFPSSRLAGSSLGPGVYTPSAQPAKAMSFVDERRQ